MKVVISSDWHLSATNRFADVCKTLDAIAKYCSWTKADYFFFLGDAYDYATPSNKERAIIHKLFTEIRGYGTKIVTIPGNHDIAKADLAGEFASTAEYINLNVPDVKVFDYPGGAITVGGVLFAFVPHIPKGQHDGVSYAEHYATLLKKIDDANPGPHEIKVLLSHVMVQEAAPVDAAKHPDILVRSIPLDMLKNSGYNLVLLGDVHAHTVLSEEPYISYVGSPDRISFNEISSEKGFYELNITDQVEIEFKPLTVRKFAGVSVVHSDDGFVVKATVSGLAHNEVVTVDSVPKLKEYLSECPHFKDAIVSLTLSAPGDIIRGTSQDEMKQCINNAGAAGIKNCKLAITDATTARDKKFIKAMDQNTALELWADAKKYDADLKKDFIEKGTSIMRSTK